MRGGKISQQPNPSGSRQQDKSPEMKGKERYAKANIQISGQVIRIAKPLVFILVDLPSDKDPTKICPTVAKYNAENFRNVKDRLKVQDFEKDMMVKADFTYSQGNELFANNLTIVRGETTATTPAKQDGPKGGLNRRDKNHGNHPKPVVHHGKPEGPPSKDFHSGRCSVLQNINAWIESVTLNGLIVEFYYPKGTRNFVVVDPDQMIEFQEVPNGPIKKCATKTILDDSLNYKSVRICARWESSTSKWTITRIGLPCYGVKQAIKQHPVQEHLVCDMIDKLVSEVLEKTEAMASTMPSAEVYAEMVEMRKETESLLGHLVNVESPKKVVQLATIDEEDEALLPPASFDLYKIPEEDVTNEAAQQSPKDEFSNQVCACTETVLIDFTPCETATVNKEETCGNQVQDLIQMEEQVEEERERVSKEEGIIVEEEETCEEERVCIEGKEEGIIVEQEEVTVEQEETCDSKQIEEERVCSEETFGNVESGDCEMPIVGADSTQVVEDSVCSDDPYGESYKVLGYVQMKEQDKERFFANYEEPPLESDPDLIDLITFNVLNEIHKQEAAVSLQEHDVCQDSAATAVCHQENDVLTAGSQEEHVGSELHDDEAVLELQAVVAAKEDDEKPEKKDAHVATEDDCVKDEELKNYTETVVTKMFEFMKFPDVAGQQLLSEFMKSSFQDLRQQWKQ